MSSYYCVFQSRSSVNVTDISSNVKTVSGCVCHGNCPANTIAVKEGHEDLSYIQERCTGHRLITSTYRGQVFPIINAHTPITHLQYNLLKKIINTELDNRKKSPLYKDAIKPNQPASLTPKDYIKKEQLKKLNDFIAQASFYKDTAPAPTLTITNDKISHIDANNAINAIKTMLNDCICYSDCNGYSSCQCYGNCNHY